MPWEKEIKISENLRDLKWLKFRIKKYNRDTSKKSNAQNNRLVKNFN